ncbi:hypothetical protein GGI12_004959 [Dipsacomyces acuminosporus]|nr:hypothetical protein GGI12_004959 [Dipsacomyces acuminosporus]
MVRDRVVAVRVGGGCTVWDKAVHALNAGAKALVVDDAEEGVGDGGEAFGPPSGPGHGQPAPSGARQQAGLGAKAATKARAKTGPGAHRQLPHGPDTGDRLKCPRWQQEERKCLVLSQHAFADAPLRGGVAPEAVDKASRDLPEDPQLRKARSASDSSASLRVQQPAEDNLIKAMDMPVVAVSSGVISELERHLISGVHVRVELL